MLVVLDSTVLIDFLRGRPAVQRVGALRSEGRVPATTAVNIEEIVRGMRPGEAPAVDRLVDGLVVLAVDEETARTAGSWRRDFGTRGITLSQADCLVAACGVQHGASLATGNPKDFPMSELRIEHWPVGA